LQQNRLFAADPTALEIFGYRQDQELTDEFMNSKRTKGHAKIFVQMLDKTIGLLGPDIDVLTHVLHELGKKHAQMGVKSSQYVDLGQALVTTIQEMSPEGSFSDEVKHSWLEIFQAMSYDMVRSENKRRQSLC
jgi:hemoglobin-like flavoprotein